MPVSAPGATDRAVLAEARREIARSVARGAGLAEPRTADDVGQGLATVAPPVYDPFSGSSSIPIEAQRLGLRSLASDLNPVAVLMTRALIDLPVRYANRPPVSVGDRLQVIGDRVGVRIRDTGDREDGQAGRPVLCPWPHRPIARGPAEPAPPPPIPYPLRPIPYSLSPGPAPRAWRPTFAITPG
jgi:hypothetical protein